MTRERSRRSVLTGTGVAIVGLVGVGSQVSADGHDVPVVIESVTPEQDLIVLRNEGNSDVDLSGYVIRWQYGNPDYDQEDSLPAGTVVEAGGELRITSGYYDTEADIDYGYDAGRIANEETNIIALLTPSEENEVSVYSTSRGEISGDDSGGDGSGEDDPEEDPDDEGDSEDDESEEDDPEDEEQGDEEVDEGQAEEEEPGDEETESEAESEDEGDQDDSAYEENEDESKEDDCPEEEPEPEPEPEDDCPEEKEKEPEPEEDDC